MVRRAFRMELRPGVAEEYRRRHEMLWPEMRDMIHAYGGHDYSIFLDPDTNVLYASLTVEDEAKWQASEKSEVCRKWWDYMAPLMVVNPDNSPVTHDLRPMFHLD